MNGRCFAAPRGRRGDRRRPAAAPRHRTMRLAADGLVGEQPAFDAATAPGARRRPSSATTSEEENPMDDISKQFERFAGRAPREGDFFGEEPAKVYDAERG